MLVRPVARGTPELGLSSVDARSKLPLSMVEVWSKRLGMVEALGGLGEHYTGVMQL